MNYTQMELDLRLDAERSLDDNIDTIVTFAYSVLMDSQEGNRVKNRHEGYGLLSEEYVNILDAMKSLKDVMAAYLKILPVDDVKAVDTVSSIELSLHKLCTAVVQMSAQAKRISGELYSMVSSQMSPLEEYAEQTTDDGFFDVEGEENGEE